MKVKLVTLDGCERFMEIENTVRVIDVPILLGTNRTFDDVLELEPAVFIRRYEYHHSEGVGIPHPVYPFDPARVLMVYVESYPYLQVPSRQPRVKTSEPIVTNKRQLREGE